MDTQADLAALVNIAHTNTYNLKHDLYAYECKFHDFAGSLKRLTAEVMECVTHIEQVAGLMEEPEVPEPVGPEQNLDGSEQETSAWELFSQDVDDCMALVKSCHGELMGLRKVANVVSKDLDFAVRVLKHVGEYMHLDRIDNGVIDIDVDGVEADRLPIPPETPPISCRPTADMTKGQQAGAKVAAEVAMLDAMVQDYAEHDVDKPNKDPTLQNRVGEPPVSHTVVDDFHAPTRHAPPDADAQIDTQAHQANARIQVSGDAGSLGAQHPKEMGLCHSTPYQAFTDPAPSTLAPPSPCDTASQGAVQSEDLVAHGPKHEAPDVLTPSPSPAATPPPVGQVFGTSLPHHVTAEVYTAGEKPGPANGDVSPSASLAADARIQRNITGSGASGNRPQVMPQNKGAVQGRSRRAPVSHERTAKRARVSSDKIALSGGSVVGGLQVSDEAAGSVGSDGEGGLPVPPVGQFGPHSNQRSTSQDPNMEM